MAAPRTNMVQTGHHLPANYLICDGRGLAQTLQYQATPPASHIRHFRPRRRALPFPGGDMTPSDVLKLIKERQAKFADLRFTDTRAEAYLRSTGIADNALFGPENEFFIFDSVRFGNEMQGCFYSIDSVEGAWNSPREYQEGNRGHRPGVKGGYFPVPPVDAYQDIRSAMCLACEEMGLKVEVHHHEVATAGQAEIGIAAGTLV